ncbi:MAG: helicase, partial [Planctomycetaceae bacterium]
MTEPVHNVASVLGTAGSIARRLPGYEPRPEQLAMAQAVEHAIASKKHLIAEAGTGVGKSFAYLVPAILAAQSEEPPPGNKKKSRDDDDD